MIKTLLRIEEQDIKLKGRDAAFIETLTEWEILPWIKYLREHGKIVNVDHYKDVTENYQYRDTYKLTWELPPEKETWFYLKFGDEYNKIRRLT